MDSRIRLAAAALALCAGLGARASTYTDIWHSPQEPGWGVNVVQQLDSAFVTLFTYDADGKPTWLVASDATVTAYSNPGGYPVFSGTLYRTRGAELAAPWQPSNATAVGTLQLEVLDRDRMRVHYAFEGRSGVKEVRRYSFAQPVEVSNYASQFLLRQVRGNQPIGTLYVQADLLVHLDSQTGQGYLRADDQLGRRCEYRGPYEVTGKLVRFSGAYTCSSGDTLAGTFDFKELEFTPNGLTGYLQTFSGSHSQYGRVAAARW